MSEGSWPARQRRRRHAATLARQVPGSVGQRLAVVLLVAAVLAGAAQLAVGRHPDSATGRLGLAATVPLYRSVAGPDTQPYRATGVSSPARRALRVRHVLLQLDQRRASAWQAGKPRLLRTVYSPGSKILAKDRRMLSDYRERGLRVRGVHLHFGRVHVLVHRAGVVRVRVVDRLSAVVAARPGGRALPLPSDQPTRHELVLRREPNGWRIAGVVVV